MEACQASCDRGTRPVGQARWLPRCSCWRQAGVGVQACTKPPPTPSLVGKKKKKGGIATPPPHTNNGSAPSFAPRVGTPRPHPQAHPPPPLPPHHKARKRCPQVTQAKGEGRETPGVGRQSVAGARPFAGASCLMRVHTCVSFRAAQRRKAPRPAFVCSFHMPTCPLSPFLTSTIHSPHSHKQTFKEGHVVHFPWGPLAAARPAPPVLDAAAGPCACPCVVVPAAAPRRATTTTNHTDTAQAQQGPPLGG